MRRKTGWKESTCPQLEREILEVLRESDHPLTANEVRKKLGLKYRGASDDEKERYLMAGFMLEWLELKTNDVAVIEILLPPKKKVIDIEQPPMKTYKLT